MSKPIVSVLIPVYNVEKYVGRCLDSVIRQTINDIEIICVNDGSTDGSAKVLEEYKKRDSRIKIVTKENGGLPSARNAGLDVAQGEYVGFVDSDDYIEPNMFEKLVDAAKSHNSEVVICGANVIPEEPRADKWFYDTLSPQYRHYDKFKPEILFGCIDTTPFLWRTIIKKSLIDKYNFRLDEEVVLGEDKSFQCKVYPYANGITVIPDKLYDYFWCRPDSLMSQMNYMNMSGKVIKHVKLVASMAYDIDKFETSVEEKNEFMRSFFEWSIPFIYDDFMHLSKKDKISCAEGLIPALRSCGINKQLYLLEQWKRDAYKYMESFVGEDANDVKLSVVIPLEYSSEKLDETIELIQSIEGDSVEFIFVNNGTNNVNYYKVQKVLYSRKNVSLYNTPRYFRYDESINVGIDLAAGKYICFFDTKDKIKKSNSLINWAKFAENKKLDYCYCRNSFSDTLYGTTSKGVFSNVKENDLCNCDFQQIIYRTEFLRDNNIRLENYSILSGLDFLSKVMVASNKYAGYDDSCYCKTRKWHQDWLRTDKCELILECLEKVSLRSAEAKLPYLHARVFHILNGDEVGHLIVNGTKPYRMPEWECPNGENSQIKSVASLYSIVENADYDLLLEAGFDEDDNIMTTLYEVISERSKFLAEV